MQNPGGGGSGETSSGGGQNNDSSDDEVESPYCPDNGPTRIHNDLGEAGPSSSLVPFLPRSLPDNIRTQEDFFRDMAEALNECFRQRPLMPPPPHFLLPPPPSAFQPSPPQSEYVPLLERMSNYQYQCAICLVKFFNMRALCGHMRVHPDRGWKGITPPPNFFSRPRGFVDPPFFKSPIPMGFYQPPFLGGVEPDGDRYILFPQQQNIQWSVLGLNPNLNPSLNRAPGPFRIRSGDDENNERRSNEEELRERSVDKNDKEKGPADAGLSTIRKRKRGFDLNQNPNSTSPPSDKEEQRKKRKEDGEGGTQSDDRGGN